MREKEWEREPRTRGNTTMIRRVIIAIAGVLGFVASLITVYAFVTGNSTLSHTASDHATPGPTFPLHVIAPGAECEHGWSSAYWSNRFGTANCLTTYTRLTSGNAQCSGSACRGVGSLEFALAADHLKLPTRYTMTVMATFMVEGEKPAPGVEIFFLLQDFLPATPNNGTEYGFVLDSSGSYDVVKADCASTFASGCSIIANLGSGSLDVTQSHTFGFQYDGKTTYAVMDGVKVDMHSSKSPAQFEYAQIAVISPDQHTPVSANFSDFRIQPD